MTAYWSGGFNVFRFTLSQGQLAPAGCRLSQGESLWRKGDFPPLRCGKAAFLLREPTYLFDEASG